MSKAKCSHIECTQVHNSFVQQVSPAKRDSSLVTQDNGRCSFRWNRSRVEIITCANAGSGSATMAEDRSWMYTCRQSRTSITPEWADKATEFVERAFRRVPPGRDVPCPCACCRNIRTRSKFDMQIHLGKNGFQPRYTVWVYHGESRTAKPSDGQLGDNGKKDAGVAAAAGEQVSKPQTKRREISDIEVYALSKLRKEERIEWGYQRYLWDKEKLQQQEQQNAPKRARTSGAPTAELAEDEDSKDADSCASSSGSI
ncbi:uncharacterized protein LOC124657043 [Lolium rigidum]|uniref:uncharacterized protein LOC124657043 n=1 Tax=Lolium rigidum TaxID=89674 RepID=UPI001F5E2A99|nr:uncharacterized protein LOC124657043 [Lolium rigidum]